MLDELGELVASEPHRDLPIADLIHGRIGVLAIEVGIELGDEPGDSGREAAPMILALIVLCSTGIDDFKRLVSTGQDPGLLQQEIEGRIRLYTALAASVPQGEIRLVDAGHVTITFRQPDAVFEAIRDVIGAGAATSQ